jgi:hypothetical protein
VASVAGHIAQVFTKAWNSATTVQTLASNLRSVFHWHPDQRRVVATVDLRKLDLDQDP